MVNPKPPLNNKTPSWDPAIVVTWVAAPVAAAIVLHVLNFF